MVRNIHLTRTYDCPDKEWLGSWPKRSDIDEIYNEDVNVYLPNGELCIVFRAGALKSTLPKEKGGSLTKSSYDYWQWASKALLTDQRGNAAGREIVTNPEIRLTLGQHEFFLRATRSKKPLVDEEEARDLISSDTRPSRTTFYVNKTEEDGLVDLEEVNKWVSVCRKRKIDFETLKEATEKRNSAKLAWFQNWFETQWVPAEDKVAAAKAAKKRYVTQQPRSNRCFSNVLGAIDRSGRIPFGRLTSSTLKRWDDFVEQTPFYLEVDAIMKSEMPEKHKFLSERFRKVKDERYNLFGTAFTSITINNNFQVAYHRDGNNAEGAVAALAVMERGDWDGGEFVFPELRIGFKIREGDILIGDNQGLIHGMLPFQMRSVDAENIMFVYYQRDKIISLDDLDCEACRKDFLAHSAIHYKDRGTGETQWAGSFQGMWASPEWLAFKKEHGMERCSNTNSSCKEDSYVS